MKQPNSLCIRTVLAEDHHMVAAGIQALLAEDPRVELVALVCTGPEAVSISKALKPDVLLLDLQLPGMHGLDVIRQVSAETRICVLSMHDEEHFIVQAMRAGAFGYVCKTAAAASLREAVQSIARGETYVCIEAQRVALRSNALNANTSGRNGISEREETVLRLAASGKSSQDIAMELGISRRTAEAHRANLMKKLALKSQTDLVRYALRRRLISV